jgi:hypothetical protein
MFHLTEAPKAIYCQGELDELGDGWYPTMEEARLAMGLKKQYERGGIFQRDLPSMLTQTPQEIKRNLEAELARRDQQRRFVEDMRNKNRAGFHGTIVMSEDALHNEPGPVELEKDEVVGGRR